MTHPDPRFDVTRAEATEARCLPVAERVNAAITVVDALMAMASPDPHTSTQISRFPGGVCLLYRDADTRLHLQVDVHRDDENFLTAVIDALPQWRVVPAGRARGHVVLVFVGEATR